jgi:GNAT superfamily N-acetyltransferase
MVGGSKRHAAGSGWRRAVVQRGQPYHSAAAAARECLLGTFALLVMDNLAHLGARSAVVEDVVVDAAHRGQGIGRAMMTHAVSVCREKGCYKMALSSNLKRERAHAFYDALGFERHGYSFRVDPQVRG